MRNDIKTLADAFNKLPVSALTPTFLEDLLNRQSRQASRSAATRAVCEGPASDFDFWARLSGRIIDDIDEPRREMGLSPLREEHAKRQRNHDF